MQELIHVHVVKNFALPVSLRFLLFFNFALLAWNKKDKTHSTTKIINRHIIWHNLSRLYRRALINYFCLLPITSLFQHFINTCLKQNDAKSV